MNTAKLDDGTCGQYLGGSDPTASKSATPTFVIDGDGAAATYEAFIDGTSIGQFHTSDPYAHVCVLAPHLSDGAHQLTFNEISPRPQAGTPFAFSVDTVAPNVPVITSIVVGAVNAQGKYPLTIKGTSDPTVQVFAYRASGTAFAGIGGARAVNGVWTIQTVPQNPGTYQISAAASDQANNLSAKSVVQSVTVGNATPPKVPGTPSLTGRASAVTLGWSAPSDGGSAITAYRVRRDATVISSPTGLSYTDAAPPVGQHTYTVAAVNAVGEGPQSNAVTVTT